MTIEHGCERKRNRADFVPAEVIHKVIDATPDPGWKLRIALPRFRGLRIASEALALTWATSRDYLADTSLAHVGLEPTHLAVLDFESSASANSARGPGSHKVSRPGIFSIDKSLSVDQMPVVNDVLASLRLSLRLPGEVRAAS